MAKRGSQAPKKTKVTSGVKSKSHSRAKKTTGTTKRTNKNQKSKQSKSSLSSSSKKRAAHQKVKGRNGYNAHKKAALPQLVSLK